MNASSIFDLDAIIGRGSYGCVYRAVERQSGRAVAIKTLSYVGEEDVVDFREQLEREVSIMRACQCENILRYYASFERGQSLWLVTELCAAGSLADVMRATGGALDERSIMAALSGTLAALGYLHTQRMLSHNITT